MKRAKKQHNAATVSVNKIKKVETRGRKCEEFDKIEERHSLKIEQLNKEINDSPDEKTANAG